jgi:hypothetical protein
MEPLLVRVHFVCTRFGGFQHRPMEHIQGFTRSHWMLPLGECLRRIALVAVTVDELVENTQNTNKKLFSASNLR